MPRLIGSIEDWRSLRPVFLDFKASSLTGWPIEIAWAELVGDQILVESYLIRPDSGWDIEAWEEEAEALHGISQDLLAQRGSPASQVAQRALQALDGRLLVSDAATYDEQWLRQLLELQPMTADPLVRDLVWLMQQMEPAARALLLAASEDGSPVHRAGPDVARLVRAWQAALTI